MHKSLVTFIRKQLKVKGISQHNGRGVYEMFADDLTQPMLDEMRVKLEELVVVWKSKGMIKEVTKTDGRIRIVFRSDAIDNSYNTFTMFPKMISPGYNLLGGVTMSF